MFDIEIINTQSDRDWETFVTASTVSQSRSRMDYLHEGNMKEVADKMKYILEYDTTKTRKENLNK